MKSFFCVLAVFAWLVTAITAQDAEAAVTLDFFSPATSEARITYTIPVTLADESDVPRVIESLKADAVSAIQARASEFVRDTKNTKNYKGADANFQRYYHFRWLRNDIIKFADNNMIYTAYIWFWD